MGKHGERPGSALHRSWKDHRKVYTNGSVDFNAQKERYEKLKEVRELQREYDEIQKQVIREKVDKINARRKKRAENEQNQEKVVVSDRKVRRMTKKQIRRLGIHKE